MASRTSRNGNGPYQRPRRAVDSERDGAEGVQYRLVVSNLHYEITEPDLVKIFQPYGTFTRNPTIRYDRSGRSTGFAYVNYESVDEAELAKRELDGVLAKGDPIKVIVESFRPRVRKDDTADNGKTSSGPGRGGSLKDRIHRPLIQRLTGGEGNAVASEDAMEVDDSKRGGGAVRNNRPNARRAVSGGAKPSRKAPPKPKTADDLDKELEAYNKTAAKADNGEDTAMA